jgi:hypothetical protein
MQLKPKKNQYGDMIVEATLDEIEQGARRIIGSRMKVIDLEKGVRQFSDEQETCPLQVTATPLKEGIYRLDVGSKCTVKNCDYFGECARLDARAAKNLQRIMAEILGTAIEAEDSRIWTPERLRDDEKLQKVIDRIIDEGC